MIQQYEHPVAILGGGLAGLTAAVQLRRHGIPIRVFESASAIAGLCQSQRDEDGFTYDCGVHFITNRLAAAVGITTECLPMAKYGETVFLDGKNYSYPFGLLRSPAFVASAIRAKLSGWIAKPAATASQWYRSQYGTRLANRVALPLTEAWSGVPSDQVAAAVGQKFATSLPRIIVLKVAAKITKRVIGIGYAGTITESPNAWHVYPRDGISAVCRRLADEVQAYVQTNSKVDQIHVDQNMVTSIRCNGQTIPVSGVVSTAPVHALSSMVLGTDVLHPLSRFRYRAMVFVNLKIHGASGLSDVVTWVPQRTFPFFRLSEIGMGLPWLVPDGKSQVTCDIGCQVGDALWNRSDDSIAMQCKEGLEQMIPGIAARVFGFRVVRVPLAYPIYHIDYEKERAQFEKGTGIQGLISVGRNGEFSHLLMEDVYWRTRWKISEFIDQRTANQLDQARRAS